MSRSVIFNEEEFPFKTDFLSTSPINQKTHDIVISWVSPPNDQISSIPGTTPNSQPCHQIPLEQPNTDTPITTPESSDIAHPSSSEGSLSCEPCPTQRLSESGNEIHIETITEQENEMNEVDVVPNEADKNRESTGHPMQTRAKNRIFKPKIKTYMVANDQNRNGNSELKSVVEALPSKDWRGAMEEEMKALEKNNTWTSPFFECL